MASFDNTRPAPFGAIAIYRVIAALQGSVENAVNWNNARRTRNMLNALSDEALEDIGITRGDINRM